MAVFFPVFRFPPRILCSDRFVQIRMPDGRAAEIPESELTSSGNETWQEVSRETSVATVGGAEVERIDRVVMRTPRGFVTLNFNNPEGGGID